MKYEIPTELLKKYGMGQKNSYEFERDFYVTFLTCTDYICNKIVEGVATWKDYAEEKEARAFAREQLATLKGE